VRLLPLLLWAAACNSPEQVTSLESPLPVVTPSPLVSAVQARYPQGIVNPLEGAFKRFDGFHLAAALWPRLSRFHAQIDQDDRSLGLLIGMLVTYQEGEEQGSPKGEIDAVLLFGERQDSPQRGLRVATYTTIADPPSPLQLIAASSDDGLRVPATAKLRLERQGGRLVVHVEDGKNARKRSFQRIDKAWALQPLGSEK
jgi:hypothetical protein